MKLSLWPNSIAGYVWELQWFMLSDAQVFDFIFSSKSPVRILISRHSALGITSTGEVRRHAATNLLCAQSLSPIEFLKSWQSPKAVFFSQLERGLFGPTFKWPLFIPHHMLEQNAVPSSTIL